MPIPSLIPDICVKVKTKEGLRFPIATGEIELTVKYLDIGELVIARAGKVSIWHDKLYEEAENFYRSIKAEISVPDEPLYYETENTYHYPIELCEPKATREISSELRPLSRKGLEKFLSREGLSFCIVMKFVKGVLMHSIEVNCLVKLDQGAAKFAFSEEVSGDTVWYEIHEADGEFVRYVVEAFSDNPLDQPKSRSIGFVTH